MGTFEGKRCVQYTGNKTQIQAIVAESMQIKFPGEKQAFTYEMILLTQGAAVSSFWNTNNIATVSSCEDTLYDDHYLQFACICCS